MGVVMTKRQKKSSKPSGPGRGPTKAKRNRSAVRHRAPAVRDKPARTNEVAARALARHIILYDAGDVATHGPYSLPTAEVMSRTARDPIPWPAGKVPTPTPLPSPPGKDAPLPQFDYVIVTWTVEEAKCLADTLTPGRTSKTDWYEYAHNFESDFVPLIRHGAPALQSRRLGIWFPTEIVGKRVACFKSDLHMSQDGAKLPILKLWQQLITEARPKLIITTGTAGGIGGAIELGDAVIAGHVRFDCLQEFKNAPFHASIYTCSQLSATSQSVAMQLCKANAGHLPSASRPPKIFTTPEAGVSPLNVVTTDFFAFDDSNNDYKLQGLGAAVEMGDATLGMAIEEIGSGAPHWAAVRNASDPQIDAQGLTLKEVGIKAAQIYERFGYWTTISSAIACWGLIVDN
jgi:hypothetical protein